MNILNNVFWGNTIMAYLIAAGSIIIAWAVLKLLRHKVIVSIKKRTDSTKSQADDILIKTVQDYLLPFGYLWINYIIITQLTLHPKFDRILS